MPPPMTSTTRLAGRTSADAGPAPDAAWWRSLRSRSIKARTLSAVLRVMLLPLRRLATRWPSLTAAMPNLVGVSPVRARKASIAVSSSRPAAFMPHHHGKFPTGQWVFTATRRLPRTRRGRTRYMCSREACEGRKDVWGWCAAERARLGGHRQLPDRRLHRYDGAHHLVVLPALRFRSGLLAPAGRQRG